MAEFKWDTDLTTDVLPISAAASRLARLLKQVRANQRPIVVTQKGYPEAVLISPEMLAYFQHVLALHQRADD